MSSSQLSGGGGYGEKTYWDQRYATEDKYDWYLNYSQFKDQLLPHIVSEPTADPATDTDAASAATNSGLPISRSECRVLIVGCGSSELSRSMFDDGFLDTTSIDYSETVIAKMRQANSDRPELQFETQDCRELKFANGSFDAIIDKGTLDAILCGEESTKNAALMLNECYRVLKPGGALVIITYGAPSSRLNYLEKPKYSWKCKHEVLGGTRFMYVCRKTDSNGASASASAETTSASGTSDTTTQ